MKTVASAIMLAFFANGQQVPVEPALPVEPAVVTVVDPAPVTVVDPAATPANSGPPANAPPANVPPAPLVPLDPGSYTCEGIACVARTLNVPAAQGFQFTCAGDCRGMTINLEAGFDPLHPGEIVDYIDSFTCGIPGGCAGMKINIANSFCDPTLPIAQQLEIHNTMARKIEINDIRCEAPGACDGMQINAQCGVDIMKTNFDCQQPGTCVGCVVKDMYELKSCDQNQNPNGAMTLPHQVPYLAIPAPAPGCIPTNSNPCLPKYGPFKTNAATPNYQNGYMTGPVPQQPVMPIEQPPVSQVVPQQQAPPATQPQQPVEPVQPVQPQQQAPPQYNPYYQHYPHWSQPVYQPAQYP